MLFIHTTFDNLKFENWPPPAHAKTKMDFHVNLGFNGSFHKTKILIIFVLPRLVSGWALTNGDLVVTLLVKPPCPNDCCPVNQGHFSNQQVRSKL